jgi:hypothetical protein
MRVPVASAPARAALARRGDVSIASVCNFPGFDFDLRMCPTPPFEDPAYFIRFVREHPRIAPLESWRTYAKKMTTA